MEEQKRIGVFGISGVGKTTLIKRIFCRTAQKILHLEGSTLIKEAMNQSVTSEALRSSSSSNIYDNQEKLIAEYWKNIKNKSIEIVVFDGHCLIDNGQELVQIPLSVVDRLKLCHLIFVDDNPETIYQRRKEDNSRDRPVSTVNELQQLQNRALLVCEHYHLELKIPLLVISASDENALMRLI